MTNRFIETEKSIANGIHSDAGGSHQENCPGNPDNRLKQGGFLLNRSRSGILPDSLIKRRRCEVRTLVPSDHSKGPAPNTTILLCLRLSSSCSQLASESILILLARLMCAESPANRAFDVATDRLVDLRWEMNVRPHSGGEDSVAEGNAERRLAPAFAEGEGPRK
jgi:hypothetical protein